ncbi:FAD-binding domain-containing protein [Cadophora sp. DSE1049]|nr:FAD-binding domain-containing protein [Cadophora sp. DSE1049]
MAVSTFFSAIKAELSKEAKLLSDPNTEEFKSALERWTDRDLKSPSAIVVVVTEEDIIKTVNLALKHDVPFVPKSGGHSSWSTIGQEGIIIDLSNYNKVAIDKSTKTVTIQSGVVNKQLITALYENDLCLPLGGGNTIGSVPQALGGGLCALSKLGGNTSDNILSARLITATGKLITVDSSTPDLLWALKGAGQYFGLTTSLTLQAYPISTLRSDDGTLWTGTYIFAIDKTGSLASVAAILMDDEEHNSANIAVVTLNPESGSPCLLVMCLFFGSTAEAEQYTSPIKALGPVVVMENRIKYSEINDGMDAFCAKGGFKRFKLMGAKRFDPEPWAEVADIFVDLKKQCPDVISGGHGFEWVTGKQKKIGGDSAWAHEEVKVWVESLSWHTSPTSIPTVDAATEKALTIATRSFKPEELHTYQNFSRDTSLISRFGSQERVERLQALKRKWDPKGVFTDVLL